jgi:hypothetical protein
MHLFTIRKAAVTVGVAIAAVGLLNASPVQAATASHFAAANLTSTGQAGYLLTPALATSSASTTFSVPALKCPATGLTGVAPGSFVFTGTGTTASISGAGVFLVCQNGATIYQAEAIVDGTGTALAVTVAKADVITTTVSVTATKVTVTLKDTTKHFAKTLTGAGAKPTEVLDGIDGLNSGTTPLGVPNFGTTALSNSSIDGKTLTLAAAKALDRATAAHVLQIKTGTLDATGKKFTETFKHS